jgi:exonuclease SbcC
MPDFQALQEIRTELERLEADVTALRTAQQSRAKLEGELALRRQELQSELNAASAEADRLEQQELLLREMESQLADLLPKLEHLGAAKQEMEALRAKRVTAQDAFNELAAQNKKLRTDITELEEVLSLLAEPKPSCPVCQTDLSGGKHAAVLDRQKQRLRAFQDSLAEVKKDGVETKRSLDDLVKQEETLEAQLRGEAALNAQRIEWQKRHEEATRYIKEAGDVKSRLLELRRRSEKEEYGQKERAALALLAKQIAGLEGKAIRFSEAQAVVRDLTTRQVEREYTRLEEAERAQLADIAEIELMSTRRNKRTEQINTEREKQATLRAELGDYDAIRLQTLSAERETREASEATDTARAQVERTRHALEDVARALELMAKKKIERDKLAKDKQAYTELAAAFGKKGVQALIIENILPELQDETNRLLARLTDNSMQVGIDTLRAARTGSHQIETLDIQITDDAGTRPYEMYSGGEAFRVNFAIRIALSRLLARRAGARLQTLVIDEGFGTQDAKGRERLVEAIEAVKDEFALILVISHIEELKDAFPSRIEITKTPTGSQITYMD